VDGVVYVFFLLRPPFTYKVIKSSEATKFQTDLKNLATIEEQIFEDYQKFMKNSEQSNKNFTSSESFLDRLSNVVDDETGQKVNKTGVLQDIREMLAGGSDTSANTLTYAFYFLCSNPEKMEKLQQEIDLLFDEKNPKDSTENMPYLKNVVNEVNRLIPAGPLIFRKALEDDWFGEFFIPKDTNVILNVWDVSVSERYWKDPQKFIPERFENEDDIVDHSFIPFGDGLRGCPGKPLALLELRIIIAKIFKDYIPELMGDRELKPWWGLVEHCGQVNVKLHPRRSAVQG